MDSRQETSTIPGRSQLPGDDTLEIELTAEDRLRLSRAASSVAVTARSVQAAIRPFEPAHESSIYRRSARIDLVCNATFALVGLILIVATVWRVMSPVAPPAAAVAPSRPIVVAAAPAAPVQKAQPLIRVKNPFDASEVFEFPVETQQQAREAMTQLLMRRARDRLAEGALLGHDVRHEGREARDGTPEILVTKLSGTE